MLIEDSKVTAMLAAIKQQQAKAEPKAQAKAKPVAVLDKIQWPRSPLAWDLLRKVASSPKGTSLIWAVDGSVYAHDERRVVRVSAGIPDGLYLLGKKKGELVPTDGAGFPKPPPQDGVWEAFQYREKEVVGVFDYAPDKKLYPELRRMLNTLHDHSVEVPWDEAIDNVIDTFGNVNMAIRRGHTLCPAGALVIWQGITPEDGYLCTGFWITATAKLLY